MQGKVSGNLLFLFVEKRNWPSREEEVCLRLWSLGQPGSEEKRLCASRHSGAALGAGRGVPRLRGGWHSSPHPSLSPEGQRRLLKPHSHPVATEPHRPASYWSLDVPISQVFFELEIPSFPLHSAPCVRPSLSLVP